jgi:hypothetical protein
MSSQLLRRMLLTGVVIVAFVIASAGSAMAAEKKKRAGNCEAIEDKCENDCKRKYVFRSPKWEACSYRCLDKYIDCMKKY